jgi:hypothetical protein
VIAPPGGRQGHRKLRPRPKAKAKWLAGSVEHDPAEVIAAAFSQSEARDPQHRRTWVVRVDGSEHQLDLIRAEAARRGITISIVIDFAHLLEFCGKPRGALTSSGIPPPRTRVAVKALAVLAGHSARVAAEITAEAEAAGLTADQRHGADVCDFDEYWLFHLAPRAPAALSRHRARRVRTRRPDPTALYL